MPTGSVRRRPSLEFAHGFPALLRARHRQPEHGLAGAASAHPGFTAGMSLRFKLNLIVAMLMLVFVAALITQEIDATRRSVREEVAASNRVATQLLQRVSWIYVRDGLPAIEGFLNRLGRVRANSITLTDDAGQTLYRSPPATYKEGRNAPAWFARWVLPPLDRQEIELPGGRMLIEADASRAILDGWDDLVTLTTAGGVAVILVNLLVFGLVSYTLRPFPAIVAGLERLQGGDFAVRLPPFAGREAAMIGTAFNRMATAMEDQIEARRQALDAEKRLSENRELTQLIERHLEEERQHIARELHDELGQSVTAIRSLALSIAQRKAEADPDSATAANLIATEAGRLYDAMHGLIPRLTPITLDSLGLADTLRDLVEQYRGHHPAIRFELTLDELPEALAPDVALAAYRIVQEGLTNALRHSQASLIGVEATGRDGALHVLVEDNGSGIREDWQRPGHFGLRGLKERVSGLGGELQITTRPAGGTLLDARLPFHGEFAR